MHVTAMVGTVRIDHIAQPQPRFLPRFMHTHFKALHLYAELLCSFANHLGRPSGALGKQLANTLALGRQLDNFEHSFIIPESQLNAAGVLEAQQAVLKAFHGKGNYTAH